MRRLAVTALLLLGACSTQSPPTARTPAPRPEPTAVVTNVTPSPTRSPGDFSFVVIGDFGSRTPTQDAVAARVRSHVERNHVDALLTTGDNIYPSGRPRYFDRAWRRPYGWVDERGLRVVASLGNHDVGGDAAAVMRLLEMPARFYATTIGAAEIFVLDANNPNKRQATWLTDRLRTSTAAWKLVVFHQPAYSCSYHDGTPAVVRQWVPVFRDGGVDLVLNGHDHNYQRFSPESGVTYVVTGGGGQSLYRLDRCAPGTPQRVAGNDRDHHFLAIDGTTTTLRLRAIRTDGTSFDDVTLQR